MSTTDEEQLKRRYREFMDLLPLTIQLAGLGPNTGPRALTPEQMEARASTIMNAYKVAKQTIREVIKGG
ncbi:MAG: hypothetical protein JNM18_04970 [Planctomycetaceae bacterium]|nr:hypothetical protein [Planctomycetaceae bacterium]